MGIEVKLNVTEFLAYLERSLVNITRIKAAVAEIGDGDGVIAEIKDVLTLASEVSAAIEWARLEGLSLDDAINIGAEALDKLVEFSGNLWGVVPAGAILESADNRIVRLLLEAGYRALRGTGDDRLSDRKFVSKIKRMFTA